MEVPEVTAEQPSGTSIAASAPSPSSKASSRGRGLWRAVRLIAVLYVFVGALQILKTGAASGLEVLTGGFLFHNAGSTLGLGWIGAMLTLSGSTVAATALTLRAAGSISEIQGFTMVTGGRLGAAFVVLLVAVIYIMRKGEGERMKPLSTAVMALVITGVIYLPGAAIGLLLLHWGPFQHIHLAAPHQFGNLIDLLYGWLLNAIDGLPALVNFFGGLILLIVSFKLVDVLMPELSEEQLQGSRMNWLRHKWPMFAMGIVAVVATMSVSVALTILVPLVAKGYVKREDLIPYIVGADLGTLVDKLIVAFIVGIGVKNRALAESPVRIILAEIIGTATVGLFIMAFVYKPFRSAIWKFQRQMLKSKTRLAAFTGSLLLIPLLIIAISATIK
jgi:solute carrier family 34 (sodium-dependent phosphate cotransporter)